MGHKNYQFPVKLTFKNDEIDNLLQWYRIVDSIDQTDMAVDPTHPAQSVHINYQPRGHLVLMYAEGMEENTSTSIRIYDGRQRIEIDKKTEGEIVATTVLKYSDLRQVPSVLNVYPKFIKLLDEKYKQHLMLLSKDVADEDFAFKIASMLGVTVHHQSTLPHLINEVLSVQTSLKYSSIDYMFKVFQIMSHLDVPRKLNPDGYFKIDPKPAII